MREDKFRFQTVTAVVIANMVGTGVFTSLGFQLLEIESGFVILAIWAVGGLIAVGLLISRRAGRKDAIPFGGPLEAQLAGLLGELQSGAEEAEGFRLESESLRGEPGDHTLYV